MDLVHASLEALLLHLVMLQETWEFKLTAIKNFITAATKKANPLTAIIHKVFSINLYKNMIIWEPQFVIDQQKVQKRATRMAYDLGECACDNHLQN